MPANPTLHPAAVFTEVRMNAGELGDWHQLLGQRWGTPKGDRNAGEAACIAIASTRHLAMVMDDRVGIEVALERELPVMRTTNLIVAAALAGWWTCEQAWDGYRAMLAAGRIKLGPELWEAEDRASFLGLCVATTLVAS
jgi:hypothetical protein